MRAIIKNNFRRLWQQKQLIILLVIFTAIAGAAAIFVSTVLTTTWNIAVVSGRPVVFESKNVNITQLSGAPKRSTLVSGKYDAIVYMNPDGSYKLDTIKSEEATAKIAAAMKGEQSTPVSYSGRGTGTNILGFLMMFLLLMGSMAMFMYSDDKEQRQITRVAASPIKISTYLLAHSIFNFGFLFIPAMIILTIIRWISGVDYGYGFWTFTGLIAVICAFSTAFSLLLYSLLSNKAESAKMTGNTIIILTSILAGSFYAFDKGSRVLELIVTILPQKAYLTLAQGLERHADFSAYLPALSYLIVLIAGFYTVSVIKTKHEFVNAR